MNKLISAKEPREVKKGPKTLLHCRRADRVSTIPANKTASDTLKQQLENNGYGRLFERLLILIAQDWNVASDRFQPLYNQISVNIRSNQ